MIDEKLEIAEKAINYLMQVEGMTLKDTKDILLYAAMTIDIFDSFAKEYKPNQYDEEDVKNFSKDYLQKHLK